MITFQKLFKEGYEENSSDDSFGLIRAFEDDVKVLEINVSSEVVGNPSLFNTFFEDAVDAAGVEYTADFKEAYKRHEWQVVESF
jgi:hypothetical protein